MKKQNASLLFTFTFSLFSLLVAAKPFGEAGSIKNNKLCETKPISEMPKINLSHYMTKDYDNKSGLLTMEKQTQTNPISKGRWAFGSKQQLSRTQLFNTYLAILGG
jgi:hypothetical protein